MGPSRSGDRWHPYGSGKFDQLLRSFLRVWYAFLSVFVRWKCRSRTYTSSGRRMRERRRRIEPYHVFFHERCPWVRGTRSRTRHHTGHRYRINDRHNDSFPRSTRRRGDHREQYSGSRCQLRCVRRVRSFSAICNGNSSRQGRYSHRYGRISHASSLFLTNG